YLSSIRLIPDESDKHFHCLPSSSSLQTSLAPPSLCLQTTQMEDPLHACPNHQYILSLLDLPLTHHRLLIKESWHLICFRHVVNNHTLRQQIYPECSSSDHSLPTVHPLNSVQPGIFSSVLYVDRHQQIFHRFQ